MEHGNTYRYTLVGSKISPKLSFPQGQPWSAYLFKNAPGINMPILRILEGLLHWIQGDYYLILTSLRTWPEMLLPGICSHQPVAKRRHSHWILATIPRLVEKLEWGENTSMRLSCCCNSKPAKNCPLWLSSKMLATGCSHQPVAKRTRSHWILATIPCLVEKLEWAENTNMLVCCFVQYVRLLRRRNSEVLWNLRNH